MPKKCRNCFFYRKITSQTYACMYILLTGHMRPCEPGAKCTERKTCRELTREEKELYERRYKIGDLKL